MIHHADTILRAAIASKPLWPPTTASGKGNQVQSQKPA